MRLNKSELARKLGCSERALSLWQKEGLPVLEHGRRGQPNVYDLAAVVAWIKMTGRGVMHSTRIDRGPIDLDALEREFGVQSMPTRKQYAREIYAHVCERGAPDMAAYFYARSGNIESALAQTEDAFGAIWRALIDYADGDADFAGEADDSTLNWLCNPEDPDRARKVAHVYQLTPRARSNLELELSFESVRTSAPDQAQTNDEGEL
jgi:hypothetical protein